MKNKKVIICSTIKNEGKNLKNFFEKINSVITGFNDYFIIFVESDSDDNSTELLNKYIKNKKGKIIKRDFTEQYNRIQKLEICRNEYLNFIKNNSQINNFDYLIIMDADGVNNGLNMKILQNSIMKENWTAIFACQKIFYYDIFALRVENFINENFINKIKRDIRNKTYKNSKDYIFYNLSRFFYLNKIFDNRYLKVKSAFGGFGIYKLNKVLEFRYESYLGQDCEHVKFNEDINNKHGGLFIDKNLINSNGINKHTINGYLCSKSNFFARRFLSKIL